MAPLVAVVGLALGVGGVAMLSRGGGDSDDRAQQIVSAGTDDNRPGESFLAPLNQEAGYKLEGVWETTIEIALGVSDDFIIAGYGPAGGDGTEGLLVWEGPTGELAQDPLGLHSPVSVTAPEALARLDAQLIHPSMVRWDGPDHAHGVAWYGPSVSEETGLVVAAAASGNDDQGEPLQTAGSSSIAPTSGARAYPFS